MRPVPAPGRRLRSCGWRWGACSGAAIRARARSGHHPASVRTLHRRSTDWRGGRAVPSVTQRTDRFTRRPSPAQRPRPPHGRSDVPGQRGHQQRADHEGVHSTPNATMKAIWTRNASGMTPSAANVAASTTPAEVITPPVVVSPRSMPCTGAVAQRLLPDPGHQEDVVVDAEGDEEDEAVQRHGGVRPARSRSRCWKTSAETPERGQEVERDGGHQEHGDQQRAEQPDEDDQDDQRAPPGR